MLALFKKPKTITLLDITLFMQQLAALMQAGISLVSSIELLEQCQEKPDMQLLLFAIRKQLLGGKHLAYSMNLHEQYFDHLSCQLIQIGEQTGQLEKNLQYIAEYYQTRLAFKQRLLQILFYPCLLSLTALLLIFSMLWWIIPKFAHLFADLHTNIPLSTQILFTCSLFLQDYSLLILCLMILSIITIIKYHTRIKWNYYLLRLPFIPRLLHKIQLAKFARHLALLLAAGLPLPQSLNLNAKLILHAPFSKVIHQLQSKIHAGKQLHLALQELDYFPHLMIQMVKTGEESGMLDQMLHKSADFLEAEINRWFERLGQLLEPLIMLILGALIGGLVIAIYLPIFNLGNALS